MIGFPYSYGDSDVHHKFRSEMIIEKVKIYFQNNRKEIVSIILTIAILVIIILIYLRSRSTFANGDLEKLKRLEKYFLQIELEPTKSIPPTEYYDLEKEIKEFELKYVILAFLTPILSNLY